MLSDVGFDRAERPAPAVSYAGGTLSSARHAYAQVAAWCRRRDGDQEKAAVGGVAGSSLMAYAGAFCSCSQS